MSLVSNPSNLPDTSQFMSQFFLYGVEEELKNIVAIFNFHPRPISNDFFLSDFLSSKHSLVLKKSNFCSGHRSHLTILNPIEHHEEHLDRQFKRHKPRNQAALFGMIEKVWNEIDLNVLYNLVDSMSRRCQAVIDAKGYPIKFSTVF